MTIEEAELENSIIQNIAIDLVKKNNRDRQKKVNWMLLWFFSTFIQIPLFTHFFGFLAFPLLIIELGILAQIIFSPSKVNTTIVWLRRFHRPENKNLPIQKVLESLARGVSIIVTLKDSKVKGSTDELLNQPGIAFRGWAAGCLLLVLFLGVTLTAIVFVRSYELSTFYIVVVLSLIYTLFLLTIFLRGKYYSNGKSINILSRKEIQRLDSLTKKIKSKEGVRKSLMVLKVKDEDWQNMVQKWLDIADVVILDISEITDNLLWEMKCCKNTVHPEQVILFYGYPKGESTELPIQQKEEIIKMWGLENWKRLSVFCYPFTEQSSFSNLIHSGNGMRTYKIAKQYQNEIYYFFAKAIYYSKESQIKMHN